MTGAVQELLNSFDALTDGEKREAAVEVLRRLTQSVPADFPEEALVEAADELFLDLDRREAANGRS